MAWCSVKHNDFTFYFTLTSSNHTAFVSQPSGIFEHRPGRALKSLLPDKDRCIRVFTYWASRHLCYSVSRHITIRLGWDIDNNRCYAEYALWTKCGVTELMKHVVCIVTTVL